MRNKNRVLAELEDLRRMLETCPHDREAAPFAQVHERFMDIVEKPGLLELGRPAHDERLKASLNALVRYMTHDKGSVDEVVMIRVKEARFIHGSFALPGWLTMFLWFEETEQGLVVLWRPGQPMHLARMSGLEVDPRHPPEGLGRGPKDEQ